MFKKLNIYRAATVALCLLLFSCTQVRFVPDDKYLLNNVEIEIDNTEVNKEEARTFVRQKENYKILGFVKFHLLLYNLSSKKKNEDWLKRIGEPPQIYDEAISFRSEDQLKQYMNNRGYFRATVKSQVEIKKKKRKVNLKHNVISGNQYLIRGINYHVTDPALRAIFFNDSVRSELKPGHPFDIYLLEKQQLNIVNLFRNKGYFYFTKDDVRFLADSSLYEQEIVLDLFIGNSNKEQVDSAKVFTPHYLNNFYFSVLPGNTSVLTNKNNAGIFTDTVKWDNYVLYQNKQIKYPPALFMRTLQMEKGSLYNNYAVEKTFNGFNRLRQFRFIDIQFKETTGQNDSNLLDCHIRLAPLSKQSTSFDIEGTNTSGNFGVAGNIYYQHRNLFKGAEIFQLRFKGAVERQQRLIGNVSEYFNTRELGIESTLIIPKLLGPGSFINNFGDFLPKTVITTGYNFQRRPEYTRTIANVKFGYDWKTTENLKHTWNLIDFNMVKLYSFDQDFVNSIKDLYIKSSFTDHLIFAMNYSVVYNNQKLNTKKDYTLLKFNIESAGNLLYLFSTVINQKLVQPEDIAGIGSSEYYQLFNTRFAQYLKSNIEFSHSYRIDKYNSVVGRAFAGVGLPFGNFDVLPFEKKYFTGGANGIRAWQVRALGPGTYKAPANIYPNQSSDIKLEANVEYRFNLAGFLEGALFCDVGNIWAINEKDNRPGAQFKLDEFYKQLALGTGTGLRVDLSYFIFRVDLGMKLRDPAQDLGNGWIIGKRPITGDDFNLSFAIGYPF